MPYILPEKRRKFRDIEDLWVETPGELNYCITRLLLNCWKQNTTYQGANDIAGALLNAYLEFYRRIVVPYEDTKLQLNGDVYP